ncbi:hypothetical protein [Virgibacillus sp. L01]
MDDGDNADYYANVVSVSVLVRPKTPKGGFLHGKTNARNGRV